MKIFLSWSGKQSLLLAKELREWLPRVFQSVEPFLSDDDIEAGEKWQDRLNTVLEDHDFGIVCLTRTNLTAPYVMFESGALAKKLGKARLIPVLCGLSETDLAKNPLTQFQYVHLSEAGIWKLAQSINASLGEKCLKDDILKSTFDLWWTKLAVKIDDILTASEAPKKKINTDEAIEEMLHTVRSLARHKGTDFFDLWREQVVESEVEQELLRDRFRKVIHEAGDKSGVDKDDLGEVFRRVLDRPNPRNKR